MAGVEERRPAVCTVRIEVPDVGSGPVTLADAEYPVDIQPRDLWLRDGHPGLRRQLKAAQREGQDAVAQQLLFSHRLAESLLASFVRPNHSVVAEIAREASLIRERATNDPGFHAFQSEDPAVAAQAVEDTVSAVYEALRARRIAYSEPPPGWDYRSKGQQRIHQLIEIGLLNVIETTALTEGKHVDARQARLIARNRVACVVNDEADFIDLIDVTAARREGLSPLPAVRDRQDGTVEVIEYRPGVAPDVTVVQPEPAEPGERRRLVDPHPPRYRAWKSALLSLDARSALLNLGTGPSAQPVILPPEGLGALEDLLHQDIELEVLSGFDLPDVVQARGVTLAMDLDPAELITTLVQRKTYIQRISQTRSAQGPVPPAKLAIELRSMARRAKEARDERGMNPLFLAIGMLRWPYQSPTKGLTSADAPIILVPVRLTQRPRSRHFALSIDTSSQAAPNHALIEWLKREHGLEIPDLVEPQADKAGLDVDHVLASVRRAVEQAGLSLGVMSEARLALLDLAAFRMWRDLNEHADTFLANPLIRHLVHTPTEPFEDPVQVDQGPDLEAIEAPVPADAAQLRAVGWAGQKRTFVLQGPPGTGKSQTITNMIAHCVGQGMRLLFVSEKQTALAVVQRRLNAIGLTPFTVNLHHEGSSAAEVRAQLTSSLTTRVHPDPTAMDNARRRLRTAHYQLARYPEALHSANAAGLSAYTAHDQMLVLDDGPAVEVAGTVVARDGAAVDAIRGVLLEVQRWAAEAGTRPHHPWRLAGPTPSGTVDVDAATQAVRQVLDGAETEPLVAEFIRLQDVDRWVRGTLASLPGVLPAGALTPFAPDGLAAVRGHVSAVTAASAPLRGSSDWDASVRSIAVAGDAVAHWDHLHALAEGWDRLTRALHVRPADLDVWRKDRGLMSAVAAHSATWGDHVTHERLLPLQRWVHLVSRLAPLEDAHESEPDAEAVTPEPDAVDVAPGPEPVRQPMGPAASAAAHEFVDAPGWGVLFDPSPTLPLPDPGTDEDPRQAAERPSTPVLTGAAVEPQTRPGRRATSDMATYTSWAGAGLTPADRASTEEIAAALEEIVRVEGPMHAELAYRRYLAASGGVRLGSAIKRTLNQVTASLVRRGRLAQIRDHVPGQIEKTLYAPGTPAVAVREIGDRSLSDVPRSEVLALIENLGLTKDDPTAKRAVLGAYGRVALTKAADAYLESCIAYS